MFGWITLDKEILMKVVGHNGQLELFEDKIRIIRKGFVALMTQGLKDDKEILIENISDIQFRKASLFTNGYIHYSTSRGKSKKIGFWQAERDENTVIFTIKQQPEFEKIKDVLNLKISHSKKRNAELSKLKLDELTLLRDMKIISEEEFQAEKKQLQGT